MYWAVEALLNWNGGHGGYDHYGLGYGRHGGYADYGLGYGCHGGYVGYDH